MPEDKVRAEAMRVRGPLILGPVTLLPIERVALRADRSDARWWFWASIEPHAVVVRDAGGVRALGSEGREVSLEALMTTVPALARALAEA